MLKFDLRCEICQTKFDANYYIPKMLQCGHTLCLKCANKMKVNNIDKCPYDRKQVDFDEEKLANNIYILSLIEGSIKKENISSKLIVEEEVLELNAKPVINCPGWKNTLDGFILNNQMFSTESNGFIYCTNLETGEWWYLYLNQFFGKFFFIADNKNMYLIDHYGNLFQIFTKNYYLQIGKKSNWKESLFCSVVGNILYTIEPNNKIFETNLENGKYGEVEIKYKVEEKSKSSSSGENDDTNYSLNSVFKNITFFISYRENLFLGNKNGEIYKFDISSRKLQLIKTDFIKTLELYTYNSKDLYFLEKNSKIIKKLSLDTYLDKEIINKINYNTQDNLDSSIFSKIENIVNVGNDIIPIKLICSKDTLAVIEKSGELYVFPFKNPAPKNLKCKFMLRNCHYQNSSIMDDGNLLILDSIRLSLNKLNIINGTEAVILHSQKFLYNLKYVFNTNSKIYFIDNSGTLHLFSENDKKIIQIGYPGICKFISDYAVHKNYLFTIENTSIFRTNLIDGIYVEFKVDIKEYDYFFADCVQLVLVNGNEVKLYNPNDNCSIKSKFKIDNFGPHLSCFALFKNYLVFYNNEHRTIEGINLSDFKRKVFVTEFPEVSFFINNTKILIAILKDGVIYTLYY